MRFFHDIINEPKYINIWLTIGASWEFAARNNIQKSIIENMQIIPPTEGKSVKYNVVNGVHFLLLSTSLFLFGSLRDAVQLSFEK